MAAKYKVAIIGTGRMGGLIEDEIPSNAYLQPIRALQLLCLHR